MPASSRKPSQPSRVWCVRFAVATRWTLVIRFNNVLPLWVSILQTLYQPTSMQKRIAGRKLIKQRFLLALKLAGRRYQPSTADA